MGRHWSAAWQWQWSSVSCSILGSLGSKTIGPHARTPMHGANRAHAIWRSIFIIVGLGETDRVRKSHVDLSWQIYKMDEWIDGWMIVL